MYVSHYIFFININKYLYYRLEVHSLFLEMESEREIKY